MCFTIIVVFFSVKFCNPEVWLFISLAEKCGVGQITSNKLCVYYMSQSSWKSVARILVSSNMSVRPGNMQSTPVSIRLYSIFGTIELIWYHCDV